jgi:hypothetical protein
MKPMGAKKNRNKNKGEKERGQKGRVIKKATRKREKGNKKPKHKKGNN